MSKYISYYDAIHWFGGEFIQIPMKVVNNYEPYLLEDYNENMDPLNEVCRVFVTSLTEESVNKLKTLFPELRFKYFELLEKWILLVDHCGTAWNGVYIEINEEAFKPYENSFNDVFKDKIKEIR